MVEENEICAVKWKREGWDGSMQLAAVDLLFCMNDVEIGIFLETHLGRMSYLTSKLGGIRMA